MPTLGSVRSLGVDAVGDWRVPPLPFAGQRQASGVARAASAWPPASRGRRVALVNARGDNFGDQLNAEATAQFCYTDLGAAITSLVYAYQPVPHPVTIPESDRPVSFYSQDLRRARLDVASRVWSNGRAGVLNRRAWRRLRTAFDGTDLVVSAAMGASIGAYKSYRELVPFIAAEEAGVPAALFFGEVTPSYSMSFDRTAVRVLRNAIVGVRGAHSSSYLQHCGVDAEQTPDATLPSIANMAGPVSGLSARRNVISIVVGDSLAWHPIYKRGNGGSREVATVDVALDAALNAKLPSGTGIELVPHSPLATEVVRLRELCQRLQATSRVVIRTDIRSSREYVRALATSRLILSLRYHPLVTAIATATPCVALAYDVKPSALVAAVDADAWMMSIERVRMEILKEALEDTIISSSDRSLCEARTRAIDVCRRGIEGFRGRLMRAMQWCEPT